jgi:ribosomal RNA-processing protein 9
VLGDYDAGQIDRDIIAERLQEDVAESEGRVYKYIASSMQFCTVGEPLHHKNPVTCVCVSGQNLYTGSKAGTLEKWDISDPRNPKRISQIKRERDKKVMSGHCDDILAIAITSDGQRLATGGADKRICVWQTSTFTHLKTFTQHRGPVMVILTFITKLMVRVSLPIWPQITFTPPATTAHLKCGH